MPGIDHNGEPNRLALLVGESVPWCPVSAGFDAEVLELAELVPSFGSPGLFAGVDLFELPPRERDAVKQARAWLAEHSASKDE